MPVGLGQPRFAPSTFVSPGFQSRWRLRAWKTAAGCSRAASSSFCKLSTWGLSSWCAEQPVSVVLPALHELFSQSTCEKCNVNIPPVQGNRYLTPEIRCNPSLASGAPPRAGAGRRVGDEGRKCLRGLQDGTWPPVSVSWAFLRGHLLENNCFNPDPVWVRFKDYFYTCFLKSNYYIFESLIFFFLILRTKCLVVVYVHISDTFAVRSFAFWTTFTTSFIEILMSRVQIMWLTTALIVIVFNLSRQCWFKLYSEIYRHLTFL